MSPSFQIILKVFCTNPELSHHLPSHTGDHREKMYSKISALHGEDGQASPRGIEPKVQGAWKEPYGKAISDQQQAMGISKTNNVFLAHFRSIIGWSNFLLHPRMKRKFLP